MLTGDCWSPKFTIVPVKFSFTVPAMWSNKVKAVPMNSAARLSGLRAQGDRLRDPLFMVTEPEAAAMAVLTLADPRWNRCLSPYWKPI